MTLTKAFVIIVLLIFSTTAYSQQIQNVDFEVKNNIMFVTYDLENCPPREVYDIKLKFKIVDDNKFLYPYSITGDVYKVSQGKRKEIVWDVLKDGSDLKGNIQATLEISQKYSTKIVGDPSNMFLSMLLPGVGTAKVNAEALRQGRTPSWNWIFPSGIYLVSLTLAISSKVKSNKFYDEYHNATAQLEMDAAYKSAQDNYKSYQIFMGIAATTWLIDVIYVAAVGSKNKKAQLNGTAKNGTGTKLYFSVKQNSYGLTLLKRF